MYYSYSTVYKVLFNSYLTQVRECIKQPLGSPVQPCNTLQYQ